MKIDKNNNSNDFIYILSCIEYAFNAKQSLHYETEHKSSCHVSFFMYSITSITIVISWFYFISFLLHFFSYFLIQLQTTHAMRINRFASRRKKIIIVENSVYGFVIICIWVFIILVSRYPHHFHNKNFIVVLYLLAFSPQYSSRFQHLFARIKN